MLNRGAPARAVEGRSRQQQQQQQQQQQHQQQQRRQQRQSNQKQRQSKAKRGHEKKQSLVFDQNERIDFVKGFSKRKQERRERAKQEALVKEKEIRKLLRQKRKDALKRLRQQEQGHGQEQESSPPPSPSPSPTSSP
jgi:hypothetical protein